MKTIKLKKYSEYNDYYAAIFYKWWWNSGKEAYIEFIESNLFDDDNFMIEDSIIYNPDLIGSVYNYFKFVRYELWAMGINYTMDGHYFHISKKNKEDKFSQFIRFAEYDLTTPRNIYLVITHIQQITGKTFDESKKILYAAMNDSCVDISNPYSSKVNSENNIGDTEAVHEVLEKTISDDDSE